MKKISPLALLSFALAALIVLTSCGGGGGSDSSKPDTEACEVLGLNARIIDGTPCTTAHSSVVAITLRSNDGSAALCSGTVISPHAVLTAAHCFLLVKVNAAYITVDNKNISADYYTVHPGAHVDEQNLAVVDDAAILHFASTINLAPVAILTSQTVKSGDIVSIFGFGLDQNQNVGTLRSGEMKVSDVTPNHLFASFGSDGSNTCSGDSGGPAILTGKAKSGIVGITSSGRDENCKKGDISLFANAQASSILDFIKKTVPEVITQ